MAALFGSDTIGGASEVCNSSSAADCPNPRCALLQSIWLTVLACACRCVRVCARPCVLCVRVCVCLCAHARVPACVLSSCRLQWFL